MLTSSVVRIALRSAPRGDALDAWHASILRIIDRLQFIGAPHSGGFSTRESSATSVGGCHPNIGSSPNTPMRRNRSLPWTGAGPSSNLSSRTQMPSLKRYPSLALLAYSEVLDADYDLSHFARTKKSFIRPLPLRFARGGIQHLKIIIQKKVVARSGRGLLRRNRTLPVTCNARQSHRNLASRCFACCCAFVNQNQCRKNRTWRMDDEIHLTSEQRRTMGHLPGAQRFRGRRRRRRARLASALSDRVGLQSLSCRAPLPQRRPPSWLWRTHRTADAA